MNHYLPKNGKSFSYLMIIYGYLIALPMRGLKYDFSTYVHDYIKRDFKRKISKIVKRIRESVVS